MRRMLEAFDRRDRAAWLEVRAGDSVVIPAPTWVEVDSVHGPEAGWEYYTTTMSAFEELSFADNHSAEAIGPDEVLVHFHAGARGRASGADVDLDLWALITFSEGRVVREAWFQTEDEARRTVASR